MGTIKKSSVQFSETQQSELLFPSADSHADEIVKEFGLRDYNAIILILGGADSIEEQLKPRLIQLFDRGIARAAAQANALIIDGGTQAGVMALMGQGVANRGYKSALIGVAPASLISYPGSETTGFALEPNHSHFVLVEGNTWSSKTQLMLNLVKALSIKTATANNTSAGQASESTVAIPKLAILAGGGKNSKNEVLYAVRQNLPLIIFEGSGGMADEIVEAYKTRDQLQQDPIMAEIIEEGELYFHSLDNSVKGIERLIIRELGIDNVLMQAWETFADYDLNANLQQKRFDKLQMSIIILGVAGTALAIVQQLWAAKTADNNYLFPWNISHYILIAIPITLTLLITAANRFKQGTKWLLLRAGAESIKREIYRYRTGAMYYKENPEQQLSKKVEDITLRTMRTEVNLSSLKPYDKTQGFPPYMYASKGGDDGFSSLTPDRYVEVRLGDQLNYFKRRSVKLDKQLKLLYWITFIIGGIGTFLAAIDLQIWIALTTALVAAFGTYLGYRQTESTLTKYNQAATDLANVKSWWNALSSEQQAQQANIDSLVEHTEQVLQSELDGWIQQMQNALAELRKNQEAPKEIEEKKEPLETLNTPQAEATGIGNTNGINTPGEPVAQSNGTENQGSMVLEEESVTSTSNGEEPVAVAGSNNQGTDGESVTPVDEEIKESSLTSARVN